MAAFAVVTAYVTATAAEAHVDNPFVGAGAYARGLGVLNRQLSDRPYSAALTRWANSAYDRNRNPLDQYGPHWSGGSGTIRYGCQQSVLDLLNAASG